LAWLSLRRSWQEKRTDQPDRLVPGSMGRL
jgi:hypothetical protein